MDDDQSGAVPVGHSDGVREGTLAGHGAVEADHDAMPEGGIAGRARLCDRLRFRPGVGYLLAVCGFRDFVTGHRCLGEESPREESGLEVYLRAVKLCPGNIFPTPYPQGYGATPPLPSPRTAHAAMQGACRRTPWYGNAGCVVHPARGRSDVFPPPPRGDPRAGSGRTAECTTHPLGPSRHALPSCNCTLSTWGGRDGFERPLRRVEAPKRRGRTPVT